MVSAAVSTVTLAKALGSPRYVMDADVIQQVASMSEPPTHSHSREFVMLYDPSCDVRAASIVQT